jgi:hypothetical protein
VRQLLQNIWLHFFLVGITIFSFSACEKKDNTVIDSPGNTFLASHPMFSLRVVNTDTINVGAIQTAEDILNFRAIASLTIERPTGKESNESVQYLLGDFQSSVIFNEGILHNDGILPDTSSIDNIYSAYVDIQIHRSLVGNFVIKMWCQDQYNNRSNTFLLPLNITRFNHAPIISNLIAPITLHRGNVLTLQIQVADSDGMADINEVSYKSLKPDGTYANNGNFIQMYDDGNPLFPSGDVVAGDGIYTYSTDQTQTAPLGTYVYTFKALDHLHALSNTITHQMTLLP